MPIKDRINSFVGKHPRLSGFLSDYKGEILTVAAVAAAVVVVTHLPTVDRCTFILTLKGK